MLHSLTYTDMAVTDILWWINSFEQDFPFSTTAPFDGSTAVHFRINKWKIIAFALNRFPSSNTVAFSPSSPKGKFCLIANCQKNYWELCSIGCFLQAPTPGIRWTCEKLKFPFFKKKIQVLDTRQKKSLKKKCELKRFKGQKGNQK